MAARPDLIDFRKLIVDIKHEKLYKSSEIAKTTHELLEKLISGDTWKTAQELIALIKERIKLIIDELPLQGTPTNIMRHVLKIIRDEYAAAFKKKGEAQSLPELVLPSQAEDLDYSEPLPDLRPRLLDHLSEYKVELQSSIENIAMQALEHIHTNEIILTIGKSNTVERFLKHAAKERTFEVFVAESAPLFRGHDMATSLDKSNIKTTLITDAAVFAVMSRVNKVIIGTQLVLADGGLRATAGMHTCALAARRYSVPVLVLAHMYKFTPIYEGSYDRDLFAELASPAEVLPFAMGSLLNKVKVYNPRFDYVPPELVTLLVSHQGGNAPSYVYRLLSELYYQIDYDI